MAIPLEPMADAAAWIGDEIQQRPEWNIALTGAEVDELLTVARANSDVRFDRPINKDTAPVPLPLLAEKLRDIQEWLEHGCGAIRISGFPADDVEERTTKIAFWHLSRHIGTPVSQSASGDRLFDVRDAGFSTEDSRARGPNTRKRLSFHTDRCDVIGFLCFRPAKSGGENLVVSSLSLFNTMLTERPDLVQVLAQPFLYQRHNVDTGNEQAYIQQPIFSICDGRFASNLLRVLIERAYAMPDTPEMTDVQREALDYLDELASRPSMHVKFRQQHGDILLLNNFVTLHRRTEFVDYEAPELKRHLFRIWLSVPNSRPLDPRFAGNYGDTQAGAIRGGMQPPSHHR